MVDYINNINSNQICYYCGKKINPKSDIEKICYDCKKKWDEYLNKLEALRGPTPDTEKGL